MIEASVSAMIHGVVGSAIVNLFPNKSTANYFYTTTL